MDHTTYPLIFYIFRYAMFAVSILFFYQAIINYILFKNSNWQKRFLFDYFGLCFFSGLYSLTNFVSLYHLSRDLNIILSQSAWVSGPIVSYFYIRSLCSYLKIENALLFKASYLLLGCAAVSVLSIVLTLFGNEPIIFDIGAIETSNVFILALGNFVKANAMSGLLASLLTIITLFCGIYFLRHISKSKSREWLLFVGIVFTVIAIINDGSMVSFPDRNIVPIMFLANALEIFRLTYKAMQRTANELEDMQDALTEAAGPVGIGLSFAGFTHDMANRVSTINYGLFKIKQSLQSDEFDKKTCLEQLKKIDKLSDDMGRLFREVTSTARREKNIKFKEADAYMIVKDALALVESRLNQNNIMPEIIRFTESKVYCKDLYLIHSLVNILNNAIDAVENTEGTKWIVIEIVEKGKFIDFRISNSGEKIPKHLVQKIFEQRFSTKKRSKGTGLGLTLAKNIIEGHKGKLTVDLSIENTCFVASIPKI